MENAKKLTPELSKQVVELTRLVYNKRFKVGDNVFNLYRPTVRGEIIKVGILPIIPSINIIKIKGYKDWMNEADFAKVPHE